MERTAELSIFKRIILILTVIFIIIVSTFVMHSCSTISNYSTNIIYLVGNTYASNDYKAALIIESEESGIYRLNDEDSKVVLSTKSNLIIGINEEEDLKVVFVTVSEKELYLQTKNIMLYKLFDE